MHPDAITYAKRFEGISGSAIRQILHMANKPGMISFAGGNPSPDALPNEVVADIAEEVLRKDGKAILQYGATEGYAPFLESLRPFVEAAVGKPVPAILPTTGSTQAIDLLCKALINPGDTVLVEEPTFLGTLQCLKLYEANIVAVPSDDEGLIPEALEAAMKAHHPKLLYVIPTFQNPTGRTTSVPRRQAIAALAAQYGVVVAEDDPYRDLRYSGTPLPAIKSFDEEGWVVFLGSFSKIVAPGIRIGYMAGEAEIIRRCTMGKQSTDVHSANLNQAIVDQYLRRNLLPAHIEEICAAYRSQLNTMLAELEKFPQGVTFTRPEGGLFIWVTLPEGMNAQALLEEAVNRQVAFVPGTTFYPQGGHENTLRLNFSMSTCQMIETGMTRLRELVESKQ